ncbi:MAG: hypothetical protein V1492_01185 [Candidatus Micrarchaeota archaeon]
MDAILASLRKSDRAAFRTREYAGLLGKRSYARLVLHRLKKKGEIMRVRNGWWAFSDSIPEAIACEISAPAYVSFHSALFLHGLTTQTPRNVQLAVTRNARKYRISGIEVREYKIGKMQFGDFYRKDSVLLANPEKAFADCLELPRSCPDIILQEAAGSVNLGKVKTFLVSKAALKRLQKVMAYVKQK